MEGAREVCRDAGSRHESSALGRPCISDTRSLRCGLEHGGLVRVFVVSLDWLQLERRWLLELPTSHTAQCLLPTFLEQASDGHAGNASYLH